MIMYVCPKCRKLFKINGTGKKAKCPKCQDTILADLGIEEENWKTTGQQDKDNAISAALNTPKQETPIKVAPVKTEPVKTAPAKTDDKEPVKKAPVMTPVPPKKEPDTSSLFDFGEEEDDKASQSWSSFFDTAPETPKKPAAETSVIQTAPAQVAPTQTSPVQTAPIQSVPEQTKQKHSTLSIVAFIISFFGCMSFVGIILAIVDLVKGKNDDNKHTLSKISLGIAGAMFVLSIVLIIGLAGSGDTAVADNEPEPAVEDVTDIPGTDEEPTEAQEETSEESTGDTIADAALAIGDAVGGLYESYEDIYNEYTVKLKDSYEEQCKTLDELVDSGADAMTISVKCGECIYKLAEVNGEGTNKMAEINVKNPLNYDDYQKWGTKLYEDYMDYGTKLQEEYVGTATEEFKKQLNSYGNSDLGDPGKSDDKEALREAFNSSLGDNKPLWYDSVRNDVTGNWRELVIYSDKAIDKDLAIEYCKAYFESDDEVHFIVNLYLKTTTQLNKYGDTLSVTCKEYKDKEEHDAKELGSGDVLDSFVVNIDTGELVE